MPCITPVTLYRPHRTMSDNHTDVVPCGKCPHCLQQRSYAWQFRLKMEEKVSSSSAFITFTYENAPLTKYKNQTLRKKDFQLFIKRLRKTQQNKIKYYAVGEYGSRTFRPHYHAIMFNLSPQYLQDYTKIESLWGHGIIQIDKCEHGSIAYVTNYINKNKEQFKELDDVENEFSLMSKKMGLNHLTPEMLTYYRENLSDTIIHSGGQKSVLPRYFKEKIFTDSELKQISNRNALFHAEQEDRFLNSYHELQWKKDQFRKQEKRERLKAQNL